MIQDPKHPPIEFPDKPVPMEEAIAAEREVIAAKRKGADSLEEYWRVAHKYDSLSGQNFRGTKEHSKALLDCVAQLKIADENQWITRARLLRAEARVQEINLHNNLFQAGQMAAQMQRQAGLIQVPGLVKQ